MELNIENPTNMPPSQSNETENRIDSNSITSEELKNGVNKHARIEVVPHTEILNNLLKQIKPIDFNLLANPRKEDGFKLSEKHLLVLTIGEILSVAKSNRWNLCKKHDFIYLYNGNFWSEIDNETIQKFLGDAAQALGVPCLSARFYQFKEKLFKQFLSDAFLPTPEISKGKVLINLLNGTFEVSPESTKLRSFDPSDFITYQLQFEYEPSATAPLFQAYLDRVLPDLDSQRVLAEYLGYVFIKHESKVLKLEKVLLLYGSGANGKSVFFEIVSALLGPENLSSFSMQSLLNESGYYRAKLVNKLVNFASELNSRIGNNALFKQLVSGEPIEARHPYGQPLVLTDYAKLIFSTNELPKDVEQTDAYFRRFLIILFGVTIPKEERDSTLAKRIIESELAGVFNWALDGLKRLLEQQQFTNCKIIEDTVIKYRQESDTVYLYLEEYNYSPSTIAYVTLKLVYEDYRTYSNKSGFIPCSVRTFSERLRAHGYIVERKNFGHVIYTDSKRVL
jgi:putative DNA primase/helicase